MVKIRLTRTGRKNYATYRVVAIDSRKKRDSKAIEELGYFLPHDKVFNINKERVEYWLSVGAQPSDTVTRHLVKEGILDKSALPQKKYQNKPGRKALERRSAEEEKAKAAKAAAEAEKKAVEEAKEAPEEEASAEETTDTSSEE